MTSSTLENRFLRAVASNRPSPSLSPLSTPALAKCNVVVAERGPISMATPWETLEALEVENPAKPVVKVKHWLARSVDCTKGQERTLLNELCAARAPQRIVDQVLAFEAIAWLRGAWSGPADVLHKPHPTPIQWAQAAIAAGYSAGAILRFPDAATDEREANQMLRMLQADREAFAPYESAVAYLHAAACDIEARASSSVDLVLLDQCPAIAAGRHFRGAYSSAWCYGRGANLNPWWESLCSLLGRCDEPLPKKAMYQAHAPFTHEYISAQRARRALVSADTLIPAAEVSI